jgi:hypothetical protein
MIKKILIAIVLLIGCLKIDAQNLQLHYDLGHGRKYLTSTVEMFKPDKYGNTFFFIDMNYRADGANGVSLGYWEIARAIKFWENPLALHVEYNGGLGIYRVGNQMVGYEINSAWLGGVEYSINSRDFSKGFTLQALYKYIYGKTKTSFQLTGVWYLNCLKDKISFTGYADFWKEDNIFKGEKTTFVFQAEPQVWFNFNKNFALGSEVEVGVNFMDKGLKVYPTIGAKATF